MSNIRLLTGAMSLGLAVLVFATLLIISTPASFAHPQSTPTPGDPPPAEDITLEHGWEEVAPMIGARSEYAAAVIDGKIYVVGGFGTTESGEQVGDIFEVYDPETDTWTALAPYPPGARHHLMASTHDGKLYVFGGSVVNPITATGSPFEVHAYDPTTDTWEMVSTLPARRVAGAAVTLGNYIYLVGGTGERSSRMYTLRFDPTTSEWEELAIPNVIRDHVAATVYDGRIYAIGGRNLGIEDYQSIEIYDPETDTWTPGADMNVGRAGFGAAVIDGQIYVAGGEVLADCTAFPCENAVTLQSMERYDPVTETWEIIGELPIPLHGLPLVTLNEDLYIISGSVIPAGIQNTGRTFIWHPIEITE